MRVPPGSTKLNGFQHGGAYLIETKHVDNRPFSGRPETALETVDRFCICSLFSDTYKIDHLPKQQVVASDRGRQYCRWWRSLVETCGTLILSFDYIRRGTRCHPLPSIRFKASLETNRATTTCTCGRCPTVTSLRG